jgi:hypothetical protein
MSECAGDSAQRATPATARPTRIVTINDAALKHRPPDVKTLTHDHQAKGIEVAESREIGRAEGSVRQVEVLWTVSVRTPILGNLDPYPQPLPASSAHPQL